MFNLGIGELIVLILLAMAALGSVGARKLPALVRRPGRPRRGELQPAAEEAPPLDRLDWLLVITGLALSFAVVASLSRR